MEQQTLAMTNQEATYVSLNMAACAVSLNLREW